ncbi:MAG TPA: response regulator [Bryobacteraceae bacterium]|nr:response regulator [Bryobacteraceae bacterium]
MRPPFQIMVVEDSATQAYKLRLLLEEQGWQISIAGTAEAALAALGDPLPDLLVVDYHLPGMRGDEFCRRIRMNLHTRGIPILMMTGSAPETAEINSLESGADDYISKFERPDILLLRIRGLLRKSTDQAAVVIAKESGFRSARILAIDDGPTYLAFLSDELRSQGYEVDSATSGAEGLARLRKRSFDCVLVDLGMPGMDGIEVCRRITALRSTLDSAPPVIILTGTEDKADMNRGFEAGADDFVSKSRDLAVLRARIQALMRRRFFQEENVRIVEELKARELETLHARAGRQMAETRAAMAEKLVQANQDLQEAHRKLKETQAQLIQNEKMASLGQLVAGIAHEINNPLAFVVNNLFIVEGGLESLGPELAPHLSEKSNGKLGKVRARLAEMSEGLGRVKELVLDLRIFSRLDEGEFKTVDVVESIDAVLLLLKHRMNSRIQVKKYYAGARMLYCYGGRLNQVLMNLIANAVDAIAGEGTIVIRTSQIPDYFAISIRDTGGGIPEAIRSKIFDPFFTTKPAGQGTGLGLAISYGIVQDHGGSIEVQSEVGAGTEFIIRIPLNLETRRAT